MLPSKVNVRVDPQVGSKQAGSSAAVDELVSPPVSLGGAAGFAHLAGTHTVPVGVETQRYPLPHITTLAGPFHNPSFGSL